MNIASKKGEMGLELPHRQRELGSRRTPGPWRGELYAREHRSATNLDALLQRWSGTNATQRPQCPVTFPERPPCPGHSMARPVGSGSHSCGKATPNPSSVQHSQADGGADRTKQRPHPPSPPRGTPGRSSCTPVRTASSTVRRKHTRSSTQCLSSGPGGTQHLITTAAPVPS